MYAYVRAYACIHTYIHTYIHGEGEGRGGSSSFVSPIAADEIYIIIHYYDCVLSLNTHYHLRAKSIYWSKSIYYGVYMLLAKSTPVSHGNSHPPP